MDVRLSARVTEIGGEPVAVFLVKDITAERAAEAEARRLREAIDNMNEGFVLYDSEERLVFSNKKYRALYPELATLALPGARREDIRRMFAESDAAAQMLDAYTDLVPELDAVSGHRTGRATREVEFRRLDGTNIKISDFQLSDGSIIGVRTDITDIRARDRHLRAIYENSFVGIALVDDQGRVAEANPTLYSMLGLAVDTPGLSCADCISESDYADFLVDMTKLIAGNVPHIAMVLEIARPDSTSFTARLRATRIFDDAGNAVYNLIFLVDVTDIKDAEARLAESEARYRSLVEDQPAFVVRYNADGTLVFINRAYTEFLGSSVEEVLKINLFDLVPPEEHQSLRDDLADLVSNQTGTPRENRYLMPDGSVRWLQWSNRAIGSEPGAPMEYQGYGLDVTESHIAAARLRESEARLAEAQSIGHIGSWYRDMTTGTLSYSTQLYSILGLDPAVRSPDTDAYVNLIHPDDRAEQGEFIRQNIMAARPFSLDHRIVRPDGITRVINLRSEPVLDGNGEQVARRGTIQDITEHKNIEAELAQAQRVGQIGSWYRDILNNTLTYSDEVFNIIGEDPANFEPHHASFLTLVHPDDRDIYFEKVTRNTQAETAYECDHRMMRRSGEVRHVQQRSEPVFDHNGVQIARRGTIQDITERKQVEAELAARESELAQAQHIGRIGNWYREAREGGIARYSKEVFRILGLDPDLPALSTDDFAAVVHPDDLEAFSQDIKDWHTHTEVIEHEHRIIRKDGEIRHVSQRSEPIVDRDGTVVARRGIIQDITERVLQDRAQSETEERLARAQQVARIGSWYRDLATGKAEYSDQAFRILGGDIADEAPSFESYVAFLHPEDRDRFLATVEQNGYLQKPYEQEYRIRRGDTGEIRHIFQQSDPVFGPDNTVIARRGFIQDITERRLAEDALKAREAELALAQHIARIGSWYRDIGSDQLTVSDEVCRIFGISPEEFDNSLGDYLNYVHEEDRAAVREQSEAVRDRDEVFEMEHRIVRADGAIRHVLDRNEPVINVFGEIIGRRGIIQDITERHAAENALRASQRQLQVITDSVPAMISYIDTDLRYRSVNKTYEDFYQLPRETIVGMSIHDLLTAEVVSEGMRPLQVALAGTPINTDVTRTYPDGQTRDMSFSYIPDRQSDGKIGGLFLLGIDITERKATENALRTSQSEMRTVLDNVAATIAYLDTSLRYRFVNQAFAGMLGLMAEDMPGMSLHEVVSEQLFDQLKPWIERAMAGEQVVFDMERTYPVGGTRDMNFSFVPDLDAANTVHGIYILGTDITRRKTAEEKMRTSETRVRLITDNLPVFIGYIAPDLRYRFVNQQYETAYGRSPEDIVGMRVKDVIGPDRFSLAESDLKRGLAGEHVKVEVPWPFHDNSQGQLLRTIVPDISADGEVLGIYVLAQELEPRDRVDAATGDQDG